uniref:Fibulin 7 n=1 Tax=Neogobius melanostomus TaxID=47308 RepID=A0A8C6SFC2_9GOBI
CSVATKLCLRLLLRLNACLCHLHVETLQSKRELQGTLKQVQKLLTAHETSYCNKTIYQTTCPKLDAPTNGRKLGKSQSVGHEVHFLCDPGYELVGAESRLCQESLVWSGQQPTCRDINECASSPCLNGGTCVDEASQFSCVCAKGWAGVTCQNIDECQLFHNGQAGRLCQHACVNTAGGYRCTCPAGYDVTRDGRGCKDIDECATRLNNCTKDQTCINTNGGFQCVRVECPKIPNATYIKTSPMRCERNPCPMDNKACSQTPNSFSYHYLSLVSNLSAPRVMFRVSALRQVGDTLRFSLLGGRPIRRYFTVQRSDRLTGQLMLVSPVQGPATLEAEVEMMELERREQLGRYITKVTMFVSQYDF